MQMFIICLEMFFFNSSLDNNSNNDYNGKSNFYKG